MMEKNGFISENISLEMLNITCYTKMNKRCLHIVDTRVLWGDNSISVKENEKLFSYVQLVY